MVSECVRKLLFSWLLLTLAAAKAAAATTFMVFPLENLTRLKSLNWIGEGIAISLSGTLETPGVETISWEERARFIEASDLPPSLPLSRASMIRMAQKAAVDRIVFGSYAGTEDRLEIVVQVLNVRTLRISNEKFANGPLSMLARMENDMAWEILADSGLTGALSRQDFSGRTRSVANKTYSDFIGCLALADETARAQALQKILDVNRDLPQASFLLGAYYFQNGNCAKAGQYLKPALKDAQGYLEAQFMLGTCSLKQDHVQEAIQAYSAILVRSQALEVLNNIGVAYLRMGDIPLATQSLVEARKLARSDLTVGLNLALLRHLQGDELAALSVLDDLAKAHPEQGMVQYLHGVALTSRGQQERAAAAFEQAARQGIDPAEMKRQDARDWALIFPAWIRRPGFTGVGESRGGDAPHRH
jgi:Flp pilus assembly protein TadD